MERLSKLPAREPLLPGESLESLVRRHALAMGYEYVGRISALLRERGEVPPSFNYLSSGPVLEGLGELFGVCAGELQKSTVHRFAKQLTLVQPNKPSPDICDSKTTLRFFRRGTSPVCPECLREEPIYERLLWSFAPLPVCSVHGVVLIERCPGCRRTLSPTRLDIRRCRCDRSFLDAQQRPLPVHLTSFSKSVQGWLQGKTPLIPGMSTAAQFWWMERLASAILRTPTWISELRQRDNLSVEIADDRLVWLAAGEILLNWPGRFEEFLDVFQTVAKHQTTSTGIGRSFGLLLSEAKWLENLGYSASAEVLRHSLLQRYTLGHLNSKVSLFKGPVNQIQVEQRPWLTQTQAAKTLGLRHGAIEGWIEQGLLTGEVRLAGNHGRSVGVVSRESVELLQQQLRNSVTVNVAAQQLGIGRCAVLEFIHRNLLQNAIRTAQGWMIPNASVEEWKQLAEALPPSQGTVAGWLTTREATRRFGRSGLTLAVLFELVRAGRVRARRANRTSVLGAILLRHNDLNSNRAQIQAKQNAEQGYPLHRLAKLLVPGRRLKEVVLQKWIAAGLLMAERHGRMRIVAASEVDRFRRTYCLADEACMLLNISRTTLSRWELSGRIVPVYSRRTHAGAGASVFLRDDVERLTNKDTAIDAKSLLATV